MVRVEGGTFQMGSNNGQEWEKPVHRVTVTGFYMGKHEVTQKEWQEIMGTTVVQQWEKWEEKRHKLDYSQPVVGVGDNHPIYFVNWYEAVEYCNKLSLKEGLNPAYQGSGDSIVCDFNAPGYRLPTEAEWEYAARGGNNPIAYEGSGENDVDAYAWYKDDNVDPIAWYRKNSNGSTQPVGTKQPNSLGLYDMSGNVYEWCWDLSVPYGSRAQTDPRGPSLGTDRIYRGGSWNNDPHFLRAAGRYSDTPSYRNFTVGFRLVRSLV